MSCSKDACRMNGVNPIRIAIAQVLKPKRKPMVVVVNEEIEIQED